MFDIAIKVEGLSKLYKIGAKQERYKTLRDTIISTFKNSIRFVARGRRNKPKRLANGIG